jgi:hypothetical protein
LQYYYENRQTQIERLLPFDIIKDALQNAFEDEEQRILEALAFNFNFTSPME